jgi:glyceraldehyde-3-phosphate dehydrogenase (NADP+)
MNGFEPWENMRMLGPPTEKRTGLSKNSIDDARGAVINEKGTAQLELYSAVLHPINKDARVSRRNLDQLFYLDFNDIQEPLNDMAESKYGQQVSLFGKDIKTLHHYRYFREFGLSLRI